MKTIDSLNVLVRACGGGAIRPGSKAWEMRDAERELYGELERDS